MGVMMMVVLWRLNDETRWEFGVERLARQEGMFDGSNGQKEEL